jgi:hypothetical protein
MSLMSRSRKMAKNNPSGGLSRGAKGALAGGLIGYLYATHSNKKPAASAQRQNLKTRNMRSEAKKKAGGSSSHAKTPSVASTSMHNNAGSAGSGAPIKPAYAPKKDVKSAPKSNPMRTVGKPDKNPKRRRPMDAMKKAAKDKKFDFGKAIRRGFGQLV